MEVHIQSQSGRYPEYKTPGACGFDFEALETTTLPPGEVVLIETGIVIATPPGYMLMLAPRSSTYKNYGLMLTNSVGIVDQDYCGSHDTIKFSFRNMRDTPVIIQAGERIGQGVFVQIGRAEFMPTTMTKENRGGFGSTGKQ